MDSIYRSAQDMAAAISEGEISCLEVTKAHLERIEAVNPQLNAVVQLAADTALAAARGADKALARGEKWGPLHGVPMTIKDAFETAGVISTAGTKGLENHVPAEDATVVERVKAAGAILLGKTNTPEITLRFVTDNYVYGRTNNPYDLDRTPGGSSGGAAAIVAAGGAAFDIGSDTGGSIRIPAHFCGLAGLKPTAGRVPRTGHVPFLEFGAMEAFTQAGPIARRVSDLALILRVISGPDWRDPMVAPVPLDEPDAVRLAGLRVATYTSNRVTAPTAETAATVRNAAEALADAGAIVTEDRPPGADRSKTLWFDMMAADGGATVRALLDRLGTNEMHPLIAWTQKGAVVPSTEFAEALAEWNWFRSLNLAFLEAYDIIVCPVTAMPATRHDEATPFDYTYHYNLLGWPIVVVRFGTSTEGLPIGVQVIARPWHEHVALAVAQHLEQVSGGWQKPAI